LIIVQLLSAPMAKMHATSSTACASQCAPVIACAAVATGADDAFSVPWA
jgi:hypothetical protein